MTKEELWQRLNTYEFPHLRPDDVRDWLGENASDDALAEAAAQIANRVQMLRPGVATGKDPLVKEAFGGWEELEEELCEGVFTRLRALKALAESGDTRSRLLPFMESHGWRSDGGWWLRAGEKEESGGEEKQ